MGGGGSLKMDQRTEEGEKRLHTWEKYKKTFKSTRVEKKNFTFALSIFVTTQEADILEMKHLRKTFKNNLLSHLKMHFNQRLTWKKDSSFSEEKQQKIIINIFYMLHYNFENTK